MPRGRGKLLDPRNLGIGVGLNEVGHALGGEAEIEARIAFELQRTIDALGYPLDARIELRRQVLGRPDRGAMALLVVEVMLELFGGDRMPDVAHRPELQLPGRQDSQPLVAQNPDIELPALDVLLGDRGSADPIMDEGDALGELLVGVDHGGLGDAVGAVLAQALDDQWQAEAGGAFYFAPHREHREGRQRDAVIGEELLGEILAARQDQPAWIAPGIGDAQKLEVARDVLVVDGLAVELFEQIEHHMRLPALDLAADRPELVLHTQRLDLVAQRPQRADHVVLGLPLVDFLLAEALGRIRRHQVWMQQHQNAQALHRESCFIGRATAAGTGCRASAQSWRSAGR